MPKKQVENIIKTAASIPSAKSRTPRIRTAKHSKSAAIVESPLAQPQPARPELTREAPAHEAIALLAYGYWESRGCYGGNALDDWFRAEAELRLAAIH